MNQKDVLHFNAKINIKIPDILETAKNISASTWWFSIETSALNFKKNGFLKKELVIWMLLHIFKEVDVVPQNLLCNHNAIISHKQYFKTILPYSY